MPSTDTGTETADAPKKGSNSLGIAILVVALFLVSFWLFPWLLALVGGVFAFVIGLFVGVLGLIVGLLAAIFGLLVWLMAMLFVLVPFILIGAVVLLAVALIIKALRRTAN